MYKEIIANDRACWEGNVTKPTYDSDNFGRRFGYVAARVRRTKRNNEWGFVKTYEVRVKYKPIEERFRELSDNWKNETRGFSQAATKINNTNYLTIIGLGIIHPEKVIKLILQDLQVQSSYWHYALKKITQENPVPKGFGTNTEKTREYWLQWANVNHKL